MILLLVEHSSKELQFPYTLLVQFTVLVPEYVALAMAISRNPSARYSYWYLYYLASRMRANAE